MASYCMDCGAALPKNMANCPACGRPVGYQAGDFAGVPNNSLDSQREYIDGAPPQSTYYSQGDGHDASRSGSSYTSNSYSGSSESSNPYGSYQSEPQPTVYGGGVPNGQPGRSDGYNEPHPDSPYAPVGIGGFLGAFVLLSIPVVNLIMMIVWACGGCKKISKRNFARAALIWMAICTILTVVAFAFLALVAAEFAEEFSEMLPYMF